MITLRDWNNFSEARRIQIITHLMPYALPEDIKTLARPFNHNLTYVGPDGNGEIISFILHSCYNTDNNSIKVVCYVQ